MQKLAAVWKTEAELNAVNSGAKQTPPPARLLPRGLSFHAPSSSPSLSEFSWVISCFLIQHRITYESGKTSRIWSVSKVTNYVHCWPLAMYFCIIRLKGASIEYVPPNTQSCASPPHSPPLSVQTYLMEAPLMRKAEKEGKGARVPFFDELDDRPLCD